MKSLRNRADGVQRQRMDQRQLSTDFLNRALEWRRVFAEGWGTFLLVVVAAGGEVVAARSSGAITPGMLAVAPGLMVMAHHLFHGHSEWGPFEPGRYLRLRGSAELPVEPSAGLRLCTNSRWCLGGAFPPGHVRHDRRAWSDDARERHRSRKSGGDRSAAN